MHSVCKNSYGTENRERTERYLMDPEGVSIAVRSETEGADEERRRHDTVIRIWRRVERTHLVSTRTNVDPLRRGRGRRR